jgi:hypothetical protein
VEGVIAADTLAETVEASTVKGGVTMRKVLVAALVGALAFLTFTTGCGSPPEPTATVTVTKTVTAATSTVGPKHGPAGEGGSSGYKLGETIKFADATFTVNKVDVTDTVQLNHGGEIRADAGEELVIVYGHYVNTTGQPQNYCGSTLGDTMYVDIYDTNGSKMS